MLGYTHCDPHIVTAKLSPVFRGGECGPYVEALRYRYRREVRYKHTRLLKRLVVGENHVELSGLIPVKYERHVLSEANLHFVERHALPPLGSGRHCLEAQGEQAHASGLGMASAVLRGKDEPYQSVSYTQPLHESHACVDRLHSDQHSSLLSPGLFFVLLSLELLLKLGQFFGSNFVRFDLDFDASQIIVNLLSKSIKKLVDVCEASFIRFAKALFSSRVNRMRYSLRFNRKFASPFNYQTVYPDVGLKQVHPRVSCEGRQLKHKSQQS